MVKSTDLLIGDIGGTNARLALSHVDRPGFSDLQTLSCEEYRSPESALASYLESVHRDSVDMICLAVAGPVSDGQVRFTNNHWTLSTTSLQKAFSTKSVVLLNDFEAIAYAIPHLDAENSLAIGLPEKDLPTDDFTVAVVGPGTGLGTAGLLRRNGTTMAIAGEGSHVGFSPESQVQMRILALLRDRFERVSAERLVSGQGIENIYWALCEIHGELHKPRTAGEIFERGARISESRAAEAVHHFFEILGQIAGDYVLSIGASDGIYIGGGIVPRYPDLLLASSFRNGFENKGRHRSLMERIPTRLITHDQPGLLGASAFTVRRTI